MIAVLLIPVLVLLAGQVGAGERSITTTECKVYYQNGTPMSSCDLPPISVDIGSVPIDMQSSVLVDRGMFLQLVREAEQAGGTLAVTLVPDIQRDRHGNAVPSPCYERMKQAMLDVAPYLSKSGDGVSVDAVYLSPSTRLRKAAEAMDREDAAIDRFRSTVKECAK